MKREFYTNGERGRGKKKQDFFFSKRKEQEPAVFMRILF